VKPNPAQFIMAISTAFTAGELSLRTRDFIQLLYFVLQGVPTYVEKH
jgi:hypothetical protein